MDGAQIGVFEQTDQIGLASLLQSHDSGALEPQVSFEVLGNLPHQTLEGQLADEELSRLLVPPDLSEGDCARPVPVRLLHTSCGGRRFSSSLSGQLLSRGLASSRFTRGLLGTCHVEGLVSTECELTSSGIIYTQWGQTHIPACPSSPPSTQSLLSPLLSSPIGWLKSETTNRSVAAVV